MVGHEFYVGREQTLVKHKILELYLQRFALIVGTGWDTLTYVDCFAGPWNSQSEKFEDSSFSIAIQMLRQARQEHAERGRSIKLRCLFLEGDQEAYKKLRQFASEISDVEILTENTLFEDSIQKIIEFIHAGGSHAFPFVFVDPTGWKGIYLETISPLLKINPGEVMINFMTGHILRFVMDQRPEQRESFAKLFGSNHARVRVEQTEPPEREDVALMEYCSALKTEGGFRYTGYAYVLHPTKDQTHYHLIYGTRSVKGIEVFKESEKRAMSEMENVRAAAEKRRSIERTGQLRMTYGDEIVPESQHYESLRNRYINRARNAVLNVLQKQERVSYDLAWEIAMAQPLVWESDLKQWITDWSAAGKLRIEGLAPRARVPQRKQKHVLASVASESHSNSE